MFVEGWIQLISLVFYEYNLRWMFLHSFSPISALESSKIVMIIHWSWWSWLCMNWVIKLMASIHFLLILIPFFKIKKKKWYIGMGVVGLCKQNKRRRVENKSVVREFSISNEVHVLRDVSSFRWCLAIWSVPGILYYHDVWSLMFLWSLLVKHTFVFLVYLILILYWIILYH